MQKFNVFDIAAISVLFIIAFSLWTIPAQNDPRPFGESDATYHFSVGDYVSSTDKPVYRVAFYLGQWFYYENIWNSIIGINAPLYPPSNHYNYALVQVVGGERFLPITIYKAIASFLGIFSVYFLIRKLYGRAVAIAASAGLVFSMREMLFYLWGQQPTLTSYVIAPVTLYAFYKYLNGYYNKEASIKYLYITAVLLGSQFLLHLQGFFLSAATLLFFTLFMLIKHRNLPFLKSGFRHLAVVALILLLIVLPMIAPYAGRSLEEPSGNYADLLRWNVDQSLITGIYPPHLFDFQKSYPLLLAPFLFLGMVFSVLRRRSKDLLLLAWLAALYAGLHAHIFLGIPSYRSASYALAEPALFFSFIAIGAVSLTAFLKTSPKIKRILKYASAAIVVIILSVGAADTKTFFEGQYPGIFRVTQEQSELAGWMRENLPENAYAYYFPRWQHNNLGNLPDRKMLWLLAYSQRHVRSYEGKFEETPYNKDSDFYAVFDYSDLGVILSSPPNYLQAGAQQAVVNMNRLEEVNFNDTEPLYDFNEIRVYKLESEIIE